METTYLTIIDQIWSRIVHPRHIGRDDIQNFLDTQIQPELQVRKNISTWPKIPLYVE